MCSNLYGTFIPTRPDPHLIFTRPESFPPTRIQFPKPLKASSSSSSSSSKAAVKLSMEATSFYDLLGIPETVTAVEIKRAYKELARKYHPDVSPPDRVEDYTKRFIRVQEAYETLSDPEMRKLYDKDMACGVHLAFSSKRRYNRADQKTEEKSEWKFRWQSQVSGLKNRSMYKDSGDNMSWGARMRQKKEDSNLRDG